jgi:hypothetical protein
MVGLFKIKCKMKNKYINFGDAELALAMCLGALVVIVVALLVYMYLTSNSI